MATCTRCKHTINIEKFTKPNGKVFKTCEGCRASAKAYRKSHKEESKAFYQVHKEEKKAYTKAYTKAHKREKKAWSKVHYQSHKEERKAYSKAYNQTHREERKAYSKVHYQSHKEERKAYSKAYSKTPAGIKTGRIYMWKVHGIIFTDVEAFYDRYLAATHCEHCSANFKDSQDRHADHDHSITDGPNIRGILCRSCNLRDVLKDCSVKE